MATLLYCILSGSNLGIALQEYVLILFSMEAQLGFSMPIFFIEFSVLLIVSHTITVGFEEYFVIQIFVVVQIS